ncbi:MAG: hypothetical protein U0736_26715 [Gemmataceae bacterium]
MKSRGSSLPRLEWLEHRCCPSRAVEDFHESAEHEHAEHEPPGLEVVAFRHGPFIWIIRTETPPVVNNGSQNGNANESASSDDLDFPFPTNSGSSSTPPAQASSSTSSGPSKSTTGSDVPAPPVRSVSTPAPVVKPSVAAVEAEAEPAEQAAPALPRAWVTPSR